MILVSVHDKYFGLIILYELDDPITYCTDICRYIILNTLYNYLSIL